METKELRIGNLVCHKSSENIDSVVCAISNQGMIRFDYNIRSWYELSDIEPIPLTEEWLLKFGFKKIGVNFELGGIAIWFSSYSKCYQLRYCFIGSDIERKINLEHVHRLQNLYFELKGEELTIKKPDLDLDKLLREFIEKAKTNIELGYNKIVISDKRYQELSSNNISGIEIIKKSDTDKLMDLSKHWIDDDSFFLFKGSDFYILGK